MRFARLYMELATLAFSSTTPLASCLGSLPLLFQEGTLRAQNVFRKPVQQ